jgi:3-hydroxyacyl-[acyl-carrier-protein] dehydratase
MKINILKRLHHRSPFLLIDEVIEASGQSIWVRKIPKAEEYYLQGHFPGTPVVPGSMMQEMTTQAAGLLITEFYSPVPDYDSDKTMGYALGVLRSIHQAKYKKFARPMDVLDIKVELILNIDTSFRFKAFIESKGEKIMSNEFTLINITDEQLRGPA